MATERSIQITVIGHASTRWRGAKTAAEADRLNQDLSNKRSKSVRAVVEAKLRQLLPGVKILPDRSYAPNVHPDGVPLGSYGVGSREPVLNPVKSPKRDPNENERLNRSVFVRIEWSSTERGVVGVSESAGPDVPSKEWKGRVKQFYGVGYGGGYMHIELAITNPQNGKTGTYSAKLYGVTLPTVPTIVKPTVFGDVGDPFTFSTKDKMILQDFAGKTIHVKNYDVSVGYKIGYEKSGTYITFVDLGPGAASLKFDSGSGFSSVTGISVDGFLLTGDLKLEKTDLDGTGKTSTVPYKIDRESRDGCIVTFPTERFLFEEIPREDRIRLGQFVERWAGKI